MTIFLPLTKTLSPPYVFFQSNTQRDVHDVHDVHDINGTVPLPSRTVSLGIDTMIRLGIVAREQGTQAAFRLSRETAHAHGLAGLVARWARPSIKAKWGCTSNTSKQGGCLRRMRLR
jgi:hypothetical protein